jgi:hypothetical protein
MSTTHHQQLVAAALEARAESTSLDFKGAFDPGSKGEWLEVLKDIAAFANSGGGVLLFGVDNDGKPTGMDCQPILDFDIARIGDKLRKYTGANVSELVLFGCERDGQRIGGLYVGPVDVPLVFITDGRYENAAGDERFAFRTGTTYFRHGAKSEPGTSDDLRQFLDRRIEVMRTSWLSGIRQVVEAPAGTEFRVVASGAIEQSNDERKVRVVAGGEAMPCVTLDPDKTHPYRQGDVVRIVNSRLAGGARINTHDVLSVRRTHDTDERPEFFYHGKFSSAQYSEAFLDWLVQSFEEDNQFFDKARAEYHNLTVRRNGLNRRLLSHGQETHSLGL